MFEGQCKWDVDAFSAGAILDMMPGGLCIYHVDDDQFSYVSKNMLDMLGYTEATFREKFDNRFSELVYEEDRESTLSTIIDQIEGKPFDSCIYRIERIDGSLMWVKDEGHLIKDTEGRECFCVTLVDITELMEDRNEEYRRREEEYNSTMHELLVSNPNARSVYKLNLTQNLCLDCHGSSAFIEKMIDAKTADEIFQRVSSIMMDDYSIKWFVSNISREKLIRKFEKGENRFTLSYRHMVENGKAVWVKTFCHLIENPNTEDIEAVVYTIDIDREYKEEKLLNKVVEEIYDCFGLIDVETGEVQYYYGNDAIDKFDVETLVRMLDKQNVNSYCKTVGKHRKQISFFYFDESKEQIVFAQADVTDVHIKDNGDKFKSIIGAVPDILSNEEGEDKVRSLIKNGKSGTLFILDIDDFKIINDTYGHRAGDQLLHNFAAYIESQFRTNDVLYRIKADRFAVFAMGIENQNKIIKKVEQLYESLNEIKPEDIPDLVTTISIGVHVHHDEDESFEEMYQKADFQLHSAKKGGKDTFRIG